MKRRTEEHPPYGEIPLIEKSSTVDGREYSWSEYDPAYMPALPPGAVRGDVSQQVYCAAHDVPRYFYVDEPRTCVQCERQFVCRAEEQKFWYETLKFNFGSVAVRCPECRREKRSEKSLRQEIAATVKQLESRPEDPHLLIELARATVTYRQKTGEGNLDRAIGACRRAREQWPLSHDALFWEARCHQLAGRTDKAAELFRDFVARAGGEKWLSRLVNEAREQDPLPPD